jgi:hypothetical protein
MEDAMDLFSEGLRGFKRAFELAGRRKIKSCIGVKNVILKRLDEMKINIGMHLYISA